MMSAIHYFSRQISSLFSSQSAEEIGATQEHGVVHVRRSVVPIREHLLKGNGTIRQRERYLKKLEYKGNDFVVTHIKALVMQRRSNCHACREADHHFPLLGEQCLWKGPSNTAVAMEL